MIQSRNPGSIQLNRLGGCRTVMLIICMIISCRTSLIASITPPDSLAPLDSVKKLIPKGYYLLTEQGARLAIKASIDAEAYLAQWKVSDEALGKSAGELTKVTFENSLLKVQAGRDAETIRLLSRKVFWANFWKYTAFGLSGFLGVKSVFK